MDADSGSDSDTSAVLFNPDKTPVSRHGRLPHVRLAHLSRVRACVRMCVAGKYYSVIVLLPGVVINCHAEEDPQVIACFKALLLLLLLINRLV